MMKLVPVGRGRSGACPSCCACPCPSSCCARCRFHCHCCCFRTVWQPAVAWPWSYRPALHCCLRWVDEVAGWWSGLVVVCSLCCLCLVFSCSSSSYSSSCCRVDHCRFCRRRTSETSWTTKTRTRTRKRRWLLRRWSDWACSGGTVSRATGGAGATECTDASHHAGMATAADGCGCGEAEWGRAGTAGGGVGWCGCDGGGWGDGLAGSRAGISAKTDPTPSLARSNMVKQQGQRQRSGEPVTATASPAARWLKIGGIELATARGAATAPSEEIE